MKALICPVALSHGAFLFKEPIMTHQEIINQLSQISPQSRRSICIIVYTYGF